MITRRLFVGAFPLALTGQSKLAVKKPRPLAAVGEFTRVVDPVTENIILRLTSLSSSSALPRASNHPVSGRERLLIFSSDRTGRPAPFQVDLRNGAVRQIADPVKLQPQSLSLERQEKSIRYLDGDSLFETGLTHGTPRLLGEGISWYSGSPDGALFLISAGKLIRRSGTSTVALADDASAAWPQPGAGGCLFARSISPEECQFFYTTGEKPAQRQALAQGRIHQPYWEPDGQSILFLRDLTTANGTLVTEIRGIAVSGGGEYTVCPTSQFASFAPNSNASVFVGASKSRAQPNLVLMLRTPCREMTLCEHHATRAADVAPVFSPDNRRIYFQSDHEGRSAIYSVNVESLVEPG